MRVQTARTPKPWLCAALIAAAIVLPARAAEHDPARRLPSVAEPATSRLLVRLHGPNDVSAKATGRTTEPLKAAVARAGVALRRQREIAPGLGLIVLERAQSGAELRATMNRIAEDPAVESVEVDEPKYAHAVANDPLVAGQWFLASDQASALRATSAWDRTQGSDGIVVAVLDTGILYDHPDLGRAGSEGRLLPGYDFVSADSDGRYLRANDGNGFDANPADPGDWVSTSDLAESAFDDCEVASSSWHGTRVAGLIGARTNNAVGVAGVTWSTWILPVRVLGKCNGFDSDILTAMRWAAGLPVDGIPDNPHPAQVINLSLGGSGACSASYRQLIDELTGLGVLVVASAGNEGTVVSSPANCPGALAVGGLRHAGTKVGFSNLGNEVAISAPAGNCVNTGAGEPCLFSIDTTSNAGTTAPGTHTYTDQVDYNVGTSFSAPLVSGAVALLRATNARLPNATLVARLQEGSRPFPLSSDPEVPVCHVPAGSGDVQAAECSCTTTTCGAGMLDAEGGVVAAARPIAVPQTTGAISAGQAVTLDGTDSVAACDRTISAWSWSDVGDPGDAVIQGADQPTASVVAPSSGTLTLRLTVTDDAGASDSADLTLSSVAASSDVELPLAGPSCPASLTVAPDPLPEPDGSGEEPPPEEPEPTGSGGGGGGALDLVALLALGLGLLRQRTARGQM